jgi:flagellar biosynthesis chaperone FliJ
VSSVLCFIRHKHKTLDKNTKHWTQTQNTGHKHKTLDTNTKHWTKTQNTGHKHKTLDKNTKHWTQTQNTGHKHKTLDSQQFHQYQQIEQRRLTFNLCVQKDHDLWRWKALVWGWQ